MFPIHKIYLLLWQNTGSKGAIVLFDKVICC